MSGAGQSTGSPELHGDRNRAALGPILMCVSIGIALLAFVSDTVGLPFDMPRSWYADRVLWYALAATTFVGGAALSWTGRPAPDWKPSRPGRRFDSVVLYTKEGCHLCDQALDALIPYRPWLPEIQVVDVGTDPELAEKYGESVPVVEIDGTPRFHGRVDEFALRRLIEGTPPKSA